MPVVEEESRATAIREIEISLSISCISLDGAEPNEENIADPPPAERLKGLATGEPFSLSITSSGRIGRGYAGSCCLVCGSNVDDE